jgi:D-glycero-beta-D-manno-heptose-7-phosphate kinase
MSGLSAKIKAEFPKRKIAVIGDIVADKFLMGRISRVSREAPVLILRHERTSTAPGAAANAASNTASLGGSVELIGAIGDDASGHGLLDELLALKVRVGGVVTHLDCSTITKTRIFAGQNYAARQQVLRVDHEPDEELSGSIQDAIRIRAVDAAGRVDAVIVSDYGYGTISDDLYQDVLRVTTDRGIPLVVDSRFRLDEYHGATTATPNREEVEQILGPEFSASNCADLRSRLGLAALLVTNGNEGMTLFEGDTPPVHIAAVGSKEPVDVTGAGDTVIAAYTLALASGLSFGEAASVANHAGGIVVMKRGTASVRLSELLLSLDGVNAAAIARDASQP